MKLHDTVRDMNELNDAVDFFEDTFSTTEGFGPDAIPDHLGCSEANAMAGLLDALDLGELASQMRYWHLQSEGLEEKDENHADWPEAARIDYSDEEEG